MRIIVAAAVLGLTLFPQGVVSQENDDLREVRASLDAMRRTGVVIMTWMSEEHRRAHPADDHTGTPAVEVVEWSSCDPISAAEWLNRVADGGGVEISTVDGWGHGLEFCYRAVDHPAGWAAGIRSPGRDGQFEGGRYSVGMFPVSEIDRDLVWWNGYFVTAPGG